MRRPVVRCLLSIDRLGSTNNRRAFCPLASIGFLHEPRHACAEIGGSLARLPADGGFEAAGSRLRPGKARHLLQDNEGALLP